MLPVDHADVATLPACAASPADPAAGAHASPVARQAVPVGCPARRVVHVAVGPRVAGCAFRWGCPAGPGPGSVVAGARPAAVCVASELEPGPVLKDRFRFKSRTFVNSILCCSYFFFCLMCNLMINLSNG